MNLFINSSIFDQSCQDSSGQPGQDSKQDIGIGIPGQNTKDRACGTKQTGQDNENMTTKTVTKVTEELRTRMLGQDSWDWVARTAGTGKPGQPVRQSGYRQDRKERIDGQNMTERQGS